MNKPVIYIIGKIKDNPNYQEDFKKTEENLKRILGSEFVIINPALFQYENDLMEIYDKHSNLLKKFFEEKLNKNIYVNEEYRYMDLSSFLISSVVDYIYVLPNANESKGAFVETVLGDKFNRKYIFEVHIPLKNIEDAILSMRIAEETKKEKVGIYMLPNWNLAVFWESIYPKDVNPVPILTTSDDFYQFYKDHPDGFFNVIKEKGWMVWGNEVSFYLVVQ